MVCIFEDGEREFSDFGEVEMNNIIIYTTEDGLTKIDLQVDKGTVWLSQQQIAELFQTTKQNVSKHIQAIYNDGELEGISTVNQELTVQKESRKK